MMRVNEEGAVFCENCRVLMKKTYKYMSARENIFFYKCPKCELLWAPKLELDPSFRSKLDEEKRRKALKDVRSKEYKDVLTILKEYVPQGLGLDVGCSYGWFITIASKQYRMHGIEAEDEIAQKARESGLDVITGLFPYDMKDTKEKYDFIVFNNVWERINHTTKLIEDTRKYLKSGGVLVITVPLSSGGLYKIAEVLQLIGRTKELARLWQLHFHSPHIYFFNKRNLTEMMSERGFKLLECKDTSSLSLNKVRERFEMDEDERHSGLKTALFTLGWPVLKRLPADKAVFFFVKEEQTV